MMRTCVPTLTEATASFGMISESRVKSSMRSMVTTRVGDDIGGSSARVGEIYSSSAGCVQLLVGSMLGRGGRGEWSRRARVLGSPTRGFAARSGCGGVHVPR